MFKEPIISEDEPCLRGDLAVHGIWEAQREALCDILVVDMMLPPMPPDPYYQF